MRRTRLVSQAYSFDMPWEEFGHWRRRVQRLGFSNVAPHVHIACLYVRCESWAQGGDFTNEARLLSALNHTKCGRAT